MLLYEHNWQSPLSHTKTSEIFKISEVFVLN